MAKLLRSFCIGYGLAALAGWWLAITSGGWIVPILVVWIGGAGLSLGVAALAVWRRSAAPLDASAQDRVFTATEVELRAWCADLAGESPEGVRRDRHAAEILSARGAARHPA